jgi:hypothetical protein
VPITPTAFTGGIPVNNYSAQFREAFGGSYARIRDAYSDDEWARVWLNGDAWNHLMLWKPYPPQDQPLLQLVATEMGLQYWNVGEPFRVDAAFVPSGRRVFGSVPFPVVAAIEHEHNVGTIQEEMAKLFHIRCPLKVAITYAPPKAIGGEGLTLWERKIQSWAKELSDTLTRYVSEDPATEYLFLLGVEGKGYALMWKFLTFSAGSQIANSIWKEMRGGERPS